MRRRVVLSVAKRELRDILRDRRTLFATFVLPLVLYPALLLGFTSLAKSAREDLGRRELKVAITRDGAPFRRPAASDGDGVAETRATTRPAGDDAASDPFLAALLAHPRLLFEDRGGAAEAAESAARGDVDLALDVPSDVGRRLARGERVELAPTFRSHDPPSKAALEAVREIVRDVRDRFAPLTLREADASSGRQRASALFGGVMSFVVTIMALLGAFTPALDLVAGEKERGTLEALLTSPASRRELVIGKYLAVTACAVGASLANLGSLAFTFQGLAGVVASSGASLAGSVGFDAAGFAVVTAALVILSALFSAVAVAVSAYARTYKEGMAYLSPLYMVVLPLAMAGLLPSAKLETLAIVPVANVALLMKKLMAGEHAPGAAALAILSLAALAYAALEATVKLFEREDVLFREGKGLFARRKLEPGEPPPAPTPGLAAFTLVLCVTAVFFSGVVKDRVLGMFVQFGLFVAVPLGLSLAARFPVRETFATRAARPAGYLGALVCAAGGVLVAIVASRVLGEDAAKETSEELKKTVLPLFERSLWIGFLCVAALPAAAEELLFRGFVYAGMRSALRPFGAALATALLFALMHMDPVRFGPTFVLGCVLGALRAVAGSVWPPMLMHFAVNAFAAWSTVVAPAEDPGLTLPGGVMAAMVGGGVALIALGLFLAGARPRRALGAAGGDR
ncbi:MAG TPA: ABC transporter permease subunit/CPBP intramembrane protease [Planctomycetota bacterium]|nr:ABC transporter permease subunit/CPBP intramembrane protease [Planctomycetota bacterium]